jgi:hypothetical protein
MSPLVWLLGSVLGLMSLAMVLYVCLLPFIRSRVGDGALKGLGLVQRVFMAAVAALVVIETFVWIGTILSW